MPVSHIRCCDRVFTPDELLEHLSDGRQRCQWTYEVAAMMLHSMVQHPSHADGSRISTTVLTQKCLRQMVWERQTDYTRSLDDLWAMYRGTMFHKQLEPYAAPGSYAEARFFVADLGDKLPEVRKALPRKDRSFSGSPDLVAPHLGILYDYKRTKEVPRFNYPWQDHVAQLNINRWLVDYADYVEIAVPPVGLPVNSDGECAGVYPDNGSYVFDMSEPDIRAAFVPYEWQELTIIYADDKGLKPITSTQSIRIPTAAGTGTKAARVADVWDDAKIEAFITEKYVAARLALLAGIAPIPKGWEYQSHILCGYCPMRLPCAANEREGR